MENILIVNNLVKYYGDFKAVDELSFYVQKGSIVGLLGPNGSGKSTTISCILSLLNYQQGDIKIFGHTISPTAYDLKRRIGVVFQDVAVFEELNVQENIRYFCGLYIHDKEQVKELTEKAISLVSLNDFRKHKPKELSGGLLRRLNIACGIAHQPELIIFDEPTVGVDPQSRNSILEGIKKLNQQGATIIYTSHYMDEVEQLCDQIVIIDKGKKIAEGTKEELLRLITMEEKVNVSVEDIRPDLSSKFQMLPNIEQLKENSNQVEVVFSKGENNLINLVNVLNQEGYRYHSLYSVRPTLNDVFLELTGKELRD